MSEIPMYPMYRHSEEPPRHRTVHMRSSHWKFTLFTYLLDSGSSIAPPHGPSVLDFSVVLCLLTHTSEVGRFSPGDRLIDGG